MAAAGGTRREEKQTAVKMNKDIDFQKFECCLKDLE